MANENGVRTVACWQIAVCCVICGIVGTYLAATLIWVGALLAESTAATQPRFWRKALLTLPLRTTVHTASSILVSGALTTLAFGLSLGWLVEGWQRRFAFGLTFGGVCWFLRVLANRVVGGQWFMRSSVFDLICLLVFGMFAASIAGFWTRPVQRPH